MPLLDIEERLFVCKPSETTVHIRVRNIGTEELILRQVFPIGDSRNYISIDLSTKKIPRKSFMDITVEIKDYWKPAQIQFDTNCPRTGKIIYVLCPKGCKGPNLWLFPNEEYNKDYVFFPSPKPSLQLPVIVQFNQESALKFNISTIELSRENIGGQSYNPYEVSVYCEKTKRKTSRLCEKTKRKTSCPGDKWRYQIVNSQDLNSQETYQIHTICIDLPQNSIYDRTVAQVIQFRICTKSQLPELKEQEIYIQLAGFEVTPSVKRNVWFGLWKERYAELEIKNLGSHPLRIFNFPTDLTKVQVEHVETDGERSEIHYPVVIQKNESKKFCITIKSVLWEWLVRGTDLSKISVPIYANTGHDPKDSYVFADEAKVGTKLFVGIFIGIFIVLMALLCWFFSGPPEQEVIVYSYPLRQTVYVNDKKAGTTPTLLKVKENASIQIGDSDKQQIKDVIKKGTIFFSSSEWQVSKGEAK